MCLSTTRPAAAPAAVLRKQREYKGSGFSRFLPSPEQPVVLTIVIPSLFAEHKALSQRSGHTHDNSAS